MKHSRIAAGLALVLALAVAYWLLHDVRWLFDPAQIQSFAERLGAWGPAGIVALMVLAILVSPVPSAPIALAAGALYGHTWGTLYVLVGAELGALAAFGIARFAGYEALRGWLGERVSAGWLGSQNALTGVVFFSRLLPFVSFDVVSYAAGLTALSAWRFALATLAGIIRRASCSRTSAPRWRAARRSRPCSRRSGSALSSPCRSSRGSCAVTVLPGTERLAQYQILTPATMPYSRTSSPRLRAMSAVSPTFRVHEMPM